MKWIAAILMITNVAVYLWAGGRQSDPITESAAVQPDVNREGMLLLSEVKPSRAAVSATSLAPAPTAGEQAEPEVQSDGSVTTGLGSADIIVSEDIVTVGDDVNQASVQLDSETETKAAMCFGVGPFKGEEAWLAATSWMVENNYAYQHVTSESRELRAVRVFLGPYAASADVDPVIALLDQRGLDHFVYQVADGSTRISLGYFTQEELATKFMTYLDSLNIAASSQAEYRRLGPFNWMEIPPGQVDSVTITGRDWNETGVTVLTVSC